jgi:phytanoyl-CoA hydroxylase
MYRRCRAKGDPFVTTTDADTGCDDRLGAFRDVGHFVVEDLFTASECDDILDHLEQAAVLALGRPDDGPLSYRPLLHLESGHLQAVACDPRWAPVVMPILGRSVRLYWEQGVAKPPRARTELPWHQDNGYAPTIPEEYVTCWLALDDADEDNGCIHVLPGSHRNGTLDHHNVAGSPFRAGYDGPEAGLAVPVRKGSVLVFSSLIMHRSGPNVTARPRRSWILQYCVGDAVHGRTGELLDDRLLVAEDGSWLDEPVRQRPIDMMEIIRNYSRD